MGITGEGRPRRFLAPGESTHLEQF
jgi:hypothetical protein